MQERVDNSIIPPDIRRLAPVLIVFFIVSFFAIGGGFLYPAIGLDWPLILYANMILMGINILAYVMVRVSMHKKNPHAFVRAVMGAMFLKMVVVVVLIITYLVIVKGNFHKPSMFIVIGLYLVYLAALGYCLTIYNKNIHDIEEQNRRKF